jgi:hypothetical protein
MSRREPNAGERADRTPLEPEDALRILRRVGFGLLVASLFVDWGAYRLGRWRAQVAAMPYRVLPDVQRPGSMLADLAVEMLDATSPRS